MDKRHLQYFSGGLVLGALITLIISSSYVKKILSYKKFGHLESAQENTGCPTDPSVEEVPPPTFHSSMPNELKTNFEGEARLQWNEVPHATQYHVRLYNEKGAVIRNWKTSRSIIYLKQIPIPSGKDVTTYRLTIASINKLNQIGKESESRKLLAFKLKNLTAPKIDSIVIED